MVNYIFYSHTLKKRDEFIKEDEFKDSLKFGELSLQKAKTLKEGLKEIIIYHNKYFKNVPKKSLIYTDNDLKK